ncbi:hypothetical protein [Nitrososphaera viennensis]|uniref:Peptidase n=1 Tax=Nitrososphaera viennensis TaxID=1034015 RepID=A0A977IDE0_9ARCH|nr:hypothetical protein [Nitrososphaera viennensis]UVS68941.1 hypothetical protein NWT39_13670 [Nitrososphaera viennensis]
MLGHLLRIVLHSRGFGRLFVLLIFFFFLLSSQFVGAANFGKAFADGGDRKEINASLKGRDGKLLVRISPPVLTSENIQDASIMFRLYDANTNETIKFTSLFLSVLKDGKQLLAPDLFHSREGILRLKIQPSPGEPVIYANKEPHLDAWEADQAGVINLRAPILLEGGLYQIHVEVFGIDSPLNIFEQDSIPKFDVYLSVGDIHSQAVQYNHKDYNMTVISYYDEVTDLSLDQGKKELAWRMPFNYNITRIKNEPDIFIHEEVRIPRNFTELADGMRFAGSVDGMELGASSLAVDPYSSGSELIVHFLINKAQIIQLVEQSPQINNKQGTMKFSLSPDADIVETSTRLFTDTGSVIVSLDWNPDQLAAGKDIELGLKFYDQFTGNPVADDVKYDLMILDQNGSQVTMRENIIAKGGNDTETLVFPENAEYHLEIYVKEIQDPAAGSGAPDSSRAGRAIGVVVVPELGTSLAMILAAASIAGVIALMRSFVQSSSTMNRNKW